MACDCNIVGLLSMNYSGITSAALNGSTQISIATDGTVLLGQSLSTLSITAWAFPIPTATTDIYLGASCAASATAEVRWIQKYDCATDTTYFIPMSGGKASITNGPLNGVSLECDPSISSRSFNASASAGPVAPYLTSLRADGYNLVYTGHPIPVRSADPTAYSLNLGPFSVTAYLQSFNLTVSPPSPATVSYSFVIPGRVL